MAFKEKLIGLILIIAGLFPFLLKVKAIGDAFSSYTFLSYLTPGEIVYQIIIILLGVLLIWKVRGKVEVRR